MKDSVFIAEYDIYDVIFSALGFLSLVSFGIIALVIIKGAYLLIIPAVFLLGIVVVSIFEFPLQIIFRTNDICVKRILLPDFVGQYNDIISIENNIVSFRKWEITFQYVKNGNIALEKFTNIVEERGVKLFKVSEAEKELVKRDIRKMNIVSFAVSGILLVLLLLSGLVPAKYVGGILPTLFILTSVITKYLYGKKRIQRFDDK